MSSKPILTVAIPAYNVELYIEETVLSIVNSKYSNELEILIVNDGSSDKTLEISHTLAQQYPCVKVIDKKNGGHGSAINAGLKHATGKYFRLLDGDDWFDTEEFDKYLEDLKRENVDLIFTDYMECFIKSNTNNPVTFYSNLPTYQTLQLDDISFPEWGAMLPTTTIKTSLLKKFGLKIDEHCFYVDQEYNLACYLCAKTAKYLPFVIYQYRLEREGQSMEKKSLIKNVTSHQKVCERLLIEYHKHLSTMSSKRQEYLKQRVIIPMCHMQYMIAIEWCKSKQHFLSFDHFISNYPNFYSNPGIAGNLTNFHRKTHGFFIKIDRPLRKFAEWKNHHLHNSSHGTSFKQKAFIFLGCLAAIIAVNALVINYVNSEQTFYYWDYSAYWKNSIDLIDSFGQSKLEGFQTIAASMATDYNYLPLVPMLPFLFIFGTSRLTFILIILNLYIVPFAFIMLIVIKRSLINRKIRYWCQPIVFATFLFSPAILIPVLNGRPDAICLIIIALIYLLLAKTRLRYISNYFVLGILTFLLILLRRYFSIWAVCLYASIFVTKTILTFKHYDRSTAIKKTVKIAIKLFTSGAIILACMFIVSRSLLARYTSGGYSDIYSAYMLGTFFDQILLFIRYYGIVFLALVITGIFITYKKYSHTPLIELITICIITSVLSFLLFTRIQTLGDQHMYMFAPFFTLCLTIIIYKLSEVNNKKLLCLTPIPFVVVLALSLYSFIGIRSTNCSNICYITGISETIRPTVRDDQETILELMRDLQQQMGTTDYVYILSSSDFFNDDLFRNSILPAKPTINISGVKHVDKRDGFPGYFFDATYIIVADPIQTHLAEGSQDVISYLAQQILEGHVSNLSLIHTYNLDNNVKLKLYRKESSYQNDLLQNIYNHFHDKYPSYPFLYESIRFQD